MVFERLRCWTSGRAPVEMSPPPPPPNNNNNNNNNKSPHPAPAPLLPGNSLACWAGRSCSSWSVFVVSPYTSELVNWSVRTAFVCLPLRSRSVARNDRRFRSCSPVERKPRNRFSWYRGNTYSTSLPLVSGNAYLHHFRWSAEIHICVTFVGQRSSPRPCNLVKVEINFIPSASSVFLTHNFVATNALNANLWASVEAKYWVSWQSLDAQRTRSRAMKTAAVKS